MSAEQANENERRWTKEQYNRKNADTGNHYDWTRRNLNFEVSMGEDGRPRIQPLRSGDPLNERLQRRIDELGFKAYKKDARNNPICCIDWVFGGDQSQMRELAFGDQDVAFDLSRDNSHIKRERPIEQWAMDTYEYAVKEWGKENVIGMEVHLDESTPHAHLLVVPTAMRKQRGRLKAGAERKEKLMVSFSGKCGDNVIERGQYTSRIHTEFAEQVGNKYGLERGDVIMELPEDEQDARVHKNKHQLEAERRSKEREQTALENARKEEERVYSLKSERESLENYNAVLKEMKDGLEKEKADLESRKEQIENENTGLEEKKINLENFTALQEEQSNILDSVIQAQELTIREQDTTILDKGKSTIRGLLGMDKSPKQKANEKNAENNRRIIEALRRERDADERASAKYLPMIEAKAKEEERLRRENSDLQNKLDKQSDYQECKRKSRDYDRLAREYDNLANQHGMMEVAVNAATTHGLPAETIGKMVSGKPFEYRGEVRNGETSIFGRWKLLLQKVGKDIALKCHMGWYHEQYDKPDVAYYPISKAVEFVQRHLKEWREYCSKRENKGLEQNIERNGGIKR